MSGDWETVGVPYSIPERSSQQLPASLFHVVETLAFISSIHRHIDMHRGPSRIQDSFHV